MFSASFVLSGGCSSNTSETKQTVADSGSPTTDSATTKTVNDHGTVVDYGSGKKVEGITVQAGSLTTKSDAVGKYSLTVPADTFTSLVLTGPEYAKTILAEVALSADFERLIPVPPLNLFHLGQGILPGYDATKGILYLIVEPTGSCASIDGGTVKVTSPADAKVSYFVNKLPDDTQTTLKSADQSIPSAAVYNIPPGAKPVITIEHPTCKMVPFPATVNGRTFNGNVAIESGDSNSVTFYFLQ